MTNVFAARPVIVGNEREPGHSPPQCPVEETVCPVLEHTWVNEEYKHLTVQASPKALAAEPGQFFQLLSPSAGEGEIWFRRPQSLYRSDPATGTLEFLYKVVGRGTRACATLKPGDMLNMVGPLGQGFKLDPAWKNIVVLGRGVGLATMAPISQVAKAEGVHVTTILSARSRDLLLAEELFAQVGDTIELLDTDGSSSVENVERILQELIAAGKADAFFTCGSNRLLQLMKRIAREHGIPGQAAMEQIMACGLGPCYICVRTFEVDGKLQLRRVCTEGPVFDLQECMGW